jgi:hypothetical protein
MYEQKLYTCTYAHTYTHNANETQWVQFLDLLTRLCNIFFSVLYITAVQLQRTGGPHCTLDTYPWATLQNTKLLQYNDTDI